MAWTDVHIIEDSFSESDTGAASAKRIFYCEADVAASCDAALSATAGGTAVAVRGEVYSITRARCLCGERAVERLSPTQFKVDCSFADPTNGDTPANLLLTGAKISTSAEGFTEGYVIDAEGGKVINTAGEPFDTPPDRQAAIAVYTITKYVTSAVKTQIKAAMLTTNNSGKTIDGDTWAADELFLSEVGFTPAGTGTEDLIQATITIKGKAGGWKDAALNVGYREVVGGKATVIKKEWDSDKNAYVACSKPWPLNADATAKVGANPTPDTIVFWPYERSAWTGVPLS